jgi:hypothetical protein
MDNAVFYTPVKTFFMLRLDDFETEDQEYHVNIFYSTAVWIRHSPSVFDDTRDPRVIEPMIEAFDPASLPVVELPNHGRVILLDEDLVPVPADDLPDMSDCGMAIDGIRFFIADGAPELITVDADRNFVPKIGPEFIRNRARFCRPEQHDDGQQISTKLEDPLSIQMFLLENHAGPDGYSDAVRIQLRHAYLLGQALRSRASNSRSAAADVQVFEAIMEEQDGILYEEIGEMIEASIDAYCEISPNPAFREFCRKSRFPMHLAASLPPDDNDEKHGRKLFKILDGLAMRHGLASLRPTADLVVLGAAAYTGSNFDRKVRTYLKTLTFLERIDDEDFYRGTDHTVMVSGIGKEMSLMFWSDNPPEDLQPERNMADKAAIAIEEFIDNRQIVDRPPLAKAGWWIRHCWRLTLSVLLPSSTWGIVRAEARKYRNELLARTGLD